MASPKVASEVNPSLRTAIAPLAKIFATRHSRAGDEEPGEPEDGK